MKVSEGGINGTVADIRLIVKFLIDSLACVAFLCHNHPSGNLNPSENDKLLTKKIDRVLNICEIELFDHLIITGEDFYSMRDNGHL
jgi:DNA repair protein RadC